MQDVAILYGLPVDGLPVMETDLTLNPTKWQTSMVDLLGWASIDIDREFANLSKVGQYSWVAATLAILYGYLCRASQKGIRIAKRN